MAKRKKWQDLADEALQVVEIDGVPVNNTIQQTYNPVVSTPNTNPGVARIVDTLNAVSNNIRNKNIDINSTVTPTVDTINNKNNASLGKKLGYVGEKVGAGVVDFGTGLASSPFQDMMAGGDLAKNKSTARNIIEGAIKWYDPLVLGNLISIPDRVNRIAEAVSDPEKTTWNKIKTAALGITGNNEIRRQLEGFGQLQSGVSRKLDFVPDAAESNEKIINAIYKPSAKIDEALENQAEEMNLGKGWRTAGNIAESIGNQIPSAVLSYYTGGAYGLPAMALSAKGNSTNEALSKGADIHTSLDSGYTKGGIEVFTEELTGGNKWFKQAGRKYAADELTNRIIDTALKEHPALNWAAKKLAGDAGEILEETISDILGVQIDQATVDPNAKYTVEDWLNTALATLVSTELMNTSYDAINYAKTGQTSYQVNKEQLRQYTIVQDATNKILSQQNTDGMSTEQISQLRGDIEETVVDIVAQGIEDIITDADAIAYYQNQVNQEQIENNTEEQETEQNENIEKNENDIVENLDEEVNEEIENNEDTDTETPVDTETLVNNISSQNVISELENYAQENNINQFTPEDVKEFIEEVLKEQRVNDDNKELLRQKYNDIVQDYLEGQNKPKASTEPIPLVDVNMEQNNASKAPRKSPTLEIREDKNKGKVLPSEIKKNQYRVGNQLETQYKGFENLGRVRMQPSAKAVNFDETKSNQNFNNRRTENATPIVKREAAVTTTLGNNQENTKEARVRASLKAMTLDKGRPFNQVKGNYKYVQSDNTLVDNFRRDAATYLKDMPESNAFAKAVEKIIKDKNIEVRFDPNLKSKDGRVANGSYSNGVITLNPNSNRAAEFLLMHELTHSIANKDMVDIIKTYREGGLFGQNANAEFNENVEKLLKSYSKGEINEEALADISGQLFGNQEFINNLSMEKPNIFKRLYNEIKYLYHQFRGYKSQNEFIEDLYNKWTQAYSRNIAKASENQNYSKSLAEQAESVATKIMEDAIIEEDGMIENFKSYLEENNIKNPTQKDIGDSLVDLIGYDNELTNAEKNKLEKKYNQVINDNYAIVDTAQKFANNEDLEYNTKQAKKNYGTALMNRFYNSLSKQQWAKVLDDINTGKIELTEEHDSSNRYGDKIVFMKMKNGKPQVTAVYETNKFALANLEVNENELNEIIDNELTKEGYNERDIKKLSESFGTTSLFNRYNTKSNTFDITSRQTSRDSKQLDRDNKQNKNREGTTRQNRGNGELKDSSLFDEKKYSKDNNEWASYVESSFKDKPLTKSNTGKKLSKQQENYFKDTKVRDNDGNLITAYHTTTDPIIQFNEFDSTGTEYYRFGDQIVNYFTNSKEMSGSYADQYYEMADTKKVKNLEEAESLVKQMNAGLASDNTIRLEKDGNGYKVVNYLYKDAYDYAKSVYENELTQEDRNLELEYGKLLSKYIASGYDNNAVPEFTSLDKYANEYSKKLDKITEKMTPEERNIFAELRRGNDGNFPDYIQTEPIVVGEYSSEENLLKNIKEDIQRNTDAGKHNIQYEGYLNITNPYIVDAYGENWDSVSNTIPAAVQREVDRITSNKEVSKALTELANKSVANNNELWTQEDENKYFDYQYMEKLITDPRLRDAVQYCAMFQFDYDKWQKDADFLPSGHEDINKYLANSALHVFKPQTISDYVREYGESYKNKMEYGTAESYFKMHYKDILGRELEGGHNNLNSQDLFNIAFQDFRPEFYEKELAKNSSTNDIVKEVIEMNKNGAKYDGVIMKNVVDYGGNSDTKAPHDLYVTFNSNQFKNVDNTTPSTDDDIRYSKENETWKEYLEREFPAKGTRTGLDTLTGRKPVKPTKTITKEEIFDTNPKNKVKDNVKALNLEKDNTKYSKEEYENYVKAKESGNENKYSKQEWERLEKKYSKIYQNEVKKNDVLVAKTNNGNNIKLKQTNNNTYEEQVKPTKNQVMPDTANKTATVGDKKVSNFYSNITEKSKFITEENRENLKENDKLKFYDAITNKETLNDAMNNLDSDPEKTVGDFFAKKDFTAEDMATGWILIKRYQDAGNYEAMSNVIETMREKGTKSGQAIQMLGMLDRLTPEGMEYYAQKQLDNAYNKFVENKSQKEIEKYANNFTLTAEEHQFIKDQMDKVAQLEDEDAKKVEVAKIVKMLSDKLPPEKGSRIKAWMRISMLGNPKTQVRNVVGNAIIQPFNWLGDTVASKIDKIMSKKTGVRTKGNTDFGALAGGFIKGAKDAVRDAKLGIDTRDINLDRFEENIGAKPFYEGHKSKVLNKGAKILNKTNSILGNIMSGGDRVFYQAIYDNSLKNQMKLNKTTVPTQQMMEIAEQEALSRTWNDSNSYTKAVLQIRNAMNKLNIKGYGLGDVLVPFAKTPANLTKAIVDYSPVGLVRSILQDGRNYRNSLQNGQYTPALQHKFADSLGKGFAGTILWTAAYALAKAGITTGASDDDKDVANFMRNALGIQPYSIKIGDKSFTYDWAQPIAAPFAAMADYQRLSEKEEKDLGSIIKTFTGTSTNILLEQSFLSSIQDVFNSYNGPAEAVQQQIQDLPARATPTFFKQIADLIDPTSRQTYVKGDDVQTAKNKIQAKIPVASKNLTAQRDTLGREIEKYGGDDNKLKYAFNVFLNPANTNKGKTSEAAEEIYRVYKATGDKTVMPRQVGYSESINGKTQPLTAEERNKWQKLSGEKVEESVKALTQNKKYQAMSDEDKAEVINGIVNYSFAKAKSDIYDTPISTTYKTAAKKEEQGIPIYDYYVDRVSKRK